MSAKASGSDAKTANGTAQNRTHNDGSAGRAFTVEQKAAVIRVRKCQTTAFYDILGLEVEKATVTDVGIKKAYRKLSLLTHPDKNGYEGADEAFKMVSRAFQILSDPDKKKQYDVTGGDPDSRFGGGSAPSNPFASGFARSAGTRAGGRMYEEEISPEELFRQFFGGGMGGFGGPFGGGGMGSPGFVFNMGGGPGFRVHQFGGARPQRRPAGATNEHTEQPTAGQALQNLLPLLILFVIPILSSLFSSSDSSFVAPKVPNYSLDTPAPPLTQLQHTKRLKAPYYVNPIDVADLGQSKWRDLERAVEGRLLYTLNVACDHETRQQEKMILDAQGWFFIDQEKYNAARDLPMKSCHRLRKYQGIR